MLEHCSSPSHSHSPSSNYEIPPNTQIGGKLCGSLPLHLATRNGCDSEILKMLFEAYPGALDKKNSMGDTPWQSLDVSSILWWCASDDDFTISRTLEDNSNNICILCLILLLMVSPSPPPLSTYCVFVGKKSKKLVRNVWRNRIPLGEALRDDYFSLARVYIVWKIWIV